MNKISIIIPIYNVEPYIGRCITSIMAQECDNFSLECILVNDGTPDRSMEIVDSMLENYQGNIDFIIVSHDTNKGLSAARNTGLRHACGDFVFFVDSDDRLEHGALKYLLSGYLSFIDNDQIDIIMGNAFVAMNNKPAMCFGNNDPQLYDNHDELGLCNLLNRKFFHTAWNKLVRRELLNKYHVIFEEGIIDEDFLWSYLVFLYARQILIMPKVTYIYENNPCSIMNMSATKITHRIKSRIISCKIILDTPPPKTRIEFYMYVFYILTRAINLYENNQDNPSVKILGNDLYSLRDRMLKMVQKNRLYLQYLFFLTSKYPLYYLTNLRFFRRYYDNIAKVVMIVSKMFIWKR